MLKEQLDDALAQLVNAELIFRRGTPPDAEYAFKHVLVQDAAYSTLLRSRRQQLHARIAATLEDQFPEIVAAQPALLARHCAEAGLAEKAVVYWLKAGRQAIARCAMQEALAQIRKGLDLLSDLPDGAARWEQELDLQIALGHALMTTKGMAAPGPGEAYARARQLCEQLNRPWQLGPVLVGQWVFRLARGELNQAEHHAEEMRHLGEARNEAMWIFYGSEVSGVTCALLGKFNDARAYLENALSLWNPRYRAFAPEPEDPIVTILMHLARPLLCLGYIDQARLRTDEAVAEARRRSPYNLAFTLCDAWYVYWAIEGVKSARTMLRSAEEVLAISSEQGFPLWSGVGNIMRGWCLGAVGQAAEGIPLLLRGIADMRATGCNVMAPFVLTTLAEV
jgi:tetratricopeptide (TPR) repeat protein